MISSQEKLLSVLPMPDSPKTSWPVHLARALPELLVLLLRPTAKASLERLQLVGMDIELKKNQVATGTPVFKNQMLSDSLTAQSSTLLSGDLVDGEDTLLNLSITYFKRGQRQFIKPDITMPASLTERALSPLSLHDVQSFFSELGQSNTIWFDQALAQLNGRPMPPIPSQMLMALLLVHCLTDAKECTHFSLTFHKSVWPKEALTLNYGHDHEGFFLAIASAGACAVSLRASP